MSHTDKTDPYWVRLNDPSLDRVVDHDHTRFGQRIYRSRYARDAAGNYIVEPPTPQAHIEPRVNLDAAMAAGVAWSQVRQHPHLYPNLLLPEPTERPRYRRERYLAHVVADHCTGDEPVVANSSWRDRPCSPQFTGESWKMMRHTYDGPRREDRQAFHGEDRRRTRDDLRGYMKAVNAADDWADLDDSEIAHSERRHTIIWW